VSEEGYFYVSRALLDHPVFIREPLCEPAAWIWLIREAAWKERTVRSGKAIVELKRGECAVSLRFLASRWKWSLAKVRRYLARLEKANMISIKSGTLTTHLTICNYEKYQDPHAEPGTEAAQKRHKQEERKGNKGRTGTRAARLPADWVIPDEWLDEAVAEGMPLHRAQASAQRMKNWSLGGGKSAAKTDWRATWRNWFRKDLEDSRGRSGRNDNGDLSTNFLWARG
jgi:hypothetical protein